MLKNSPADLINFTFLFLQGMYNNGKRKQLMRIFYYLDCLSENPISKNMSFSNSVSCTIEAEEGKLTLFLSRIPICLSC